jgi:hypothetical protein
VLTQFALAGVGSLIVAATIGVASLWAWKDTEPHPVFRSVRLAAAVCLAASVLHPGIVAWIPGLRLLPWALSVGVPGVALLVSYFCKGARASLREWVFVVAVLFAVFWAPRTRTGDFTNIAHRQFDSRDVILIGFDSINRDDTLGELSAFEPTHGRKIVFTNAQTPFPATSPAWRSILSGHYPPRSAAVPSLRWGAEGSGWLPADLRKAGYDPSIAQDTPSSNWFGAGEQIRANNVQGWKSLLQSVVWKVVFPLSSVGGPWWVELLGGPAYLSTRPAQCADCFISESLHDMARAAAKGPVFWAIHTCMAHDPIQLSLSEAIRVPGWWRRSPTFFLGQDRADPRSRAARIDSVRGTIRSTLDLLDRGGVLGRASVFLLADHGPRGDGVPSVQTNNVMLTAFLPGERTSTVVNAPVSLVDIAPTVRKLVGLPDVPTDGRVLPMTDADGDPTRVVRTMTVESSGVLRALGIGEKPMTLDQLRSLATLQTDGTFDYSPEFLAKVKATLN